MGVLDLEDQLVFYRSYHYNKTNVLIHSVFVPTILFASLGLANNVKIFGITLGLTAAIGYAVFYILLNWKTGLIATPIVLGMGWFTNEWLKVDHDKFNKLYLTLFIVGWVVQFIGHGFFEKRAPALLDNLVQALVLAPYFVLFEGIFLLGFDHDLQQRIDERVSINIKEFREKKTNTSLNKK